MNVLLPCECHSRVTREPACEIALLHRSRHTYTHAHTSLAHSPEPRRSAARSRNGAELDSETVNASGGGGRAAPGAPVQLSRRARLLHAFRESCAYIAIINRGHSASVLRLRFISRSTSSIPLVLPTARFDSRRGGPRRRLHRSRSKISPVPLSLESEFNVLFNVAARRVLSPRPATRALSGARTLESAHDRVSSQGSIPRERETPTRGQKPRHAVEQINRRISKSSWTLRRSENSTYATRGTSHSSARRRQPATLARRRGRAERRGVVRSRRETGGPFRKGALGVECTGRLSSTDCHRSKLLTAPRQPSAPRR